MQYPESLYIISEVAFKEVITFKLVDDVRMKEFSLQGRMNSFLCCHKSFSNMYMHTKDLEGK